MAQDPAPVKTSFINSRAGVVAGLSLALAWGRGLAADPARWEFEGSLAAAAVGGTLGVGFSPPATTAQWAYSTGTIGGLSARFATFTRGTFFRVTHGLGANGGGQRLNQYTLILDVQFPSRPARWAALMQTNPSNTDDGDWFINPAGGVGISGVYGGWVPVGEWHRLALAVDLVAGTFRSYVDGVPVQTLTVSGLDGRFSLGPEFLLFADQDGENAGGWVNSLQVRPEVLGDATLALLGGPEAGGIPFEETPPGNPLFGTPLQVNGGFESMFSGWSVAEGRPAVLGTGTAKGTPHGGSRFLHGGTGRPGNAVVRQLIPLDGFSEVELAGAWVEADGWLRNGYPAGTFDDQVHYRLGFLDRDGRELSSVRSLLAADQVWLQRKVLAAIPAGTRVLRLDVIGRHRRDDDNDSMADDLQVRVVPGRTIPAPVLTKRPMLQGVQADSMTLLWETDHNLTAPSVEWGRADVSQRVERQVETIQVDASHHVHRVTLRGLEEETEYVYRVRNGPTTSATYRFRTAPRPGTPFVTAWWGDSHSGTTMLRRHVGNLLRHAPDLICVAGDMVNNGNSVNEWHDYWFKPLEHQDAAQTTPVVFARGNHDGEHALAYAYSALPGNESWYAFTYGNTRFLFLDSEADGSVSPEQLVWLRAELFRPETVRAAFRIVCFHKPPWSQFWNGGGHTQEPFVITEWVPLFRSRGVDLVICGHEHAYTRGALNGVTYVVSGGGGGVLDTERVANWGHIKVEYSRYHYDILSVDGRHLTWQTFDDGNQLLDEFVLVSRAPEIGIEPAPGGGFRLRVDGRPGLRYRIESSPTFDGTATTWSAEGEVLGANVPVYWTLPTGEAARVLRVQSLP